MIDAVKHDRTTNDDDGLLLLPNPSTSTASSSLSSSLFDPFETLIAADVEWIQRHYDRLHSNNRTDSNTSRQEQQPRHAVDVLETSRTGSETMLVPEKQQKRHTHRQSRKKRKRKKKYLCNN